MGKRYDQQYWQVYYQTGMCGGSFTCDAEAEALALAQSLTKARHFKGVAVVYYPADCETMFDGRIVMEAGAEDVIPCRPHGASDVTMIAAVAAALLAHEAKYCEPEMRHDRLADALAAAGASPLFALGAHLPEWAAAFDVQPCAGSLWWALSELPD